MKADLLKLISLAYTIFCSPKELHASTKCIQFILKFILFMQICASSKLYKPNAGNFRQNVSLEYS